MSLAQAAPARNTGWGPPRLAGAGGYPRLGALVVVALSVLLALLVWDDYGVGWDAEAQRRIAQQGMKVVLGKDDAGYRLAHNEFYGLAWEAPLLLAEAGLNDTRDIYFVRHLLTHLLFIVGGLCCSMLAYRMFGDRRLAVVALALFLLHPRIHAYSFINTKDVPFLSLFMVSLLAAHHAFHRCTVRAFLVCGVSIGVLANLRIMGVGLFVAVVGLWTLVFLLSRKRGDGLGLATGGALVGGTVLTLYALSPALWANPARLITAAAMLNSHSTMVTEVFQGQLASTGQLSAQYIPAWVAISTTPITLALGVIGGLAICVRGVARPSAIFTNPARRFEWLLLACLVLPIGVVVVLDSHVHDGWRHMFFLWAPLTMLAVVGLAEVMRLASRNGKRVVLALVWGGAATTFAQAAAMHPYPYAYFNFLVDRSTPERLRWQYDMDWRHNAYAEALRALPALHADVSILAATTPAMHEHLIGLQRRILPPNVRSWVFLAGERAPDVTLFHEGVARLGVLPANNVIFKAKAYNNTIALVVGGSGDARREEWDASYERFVSKPLLARSGFSVHAGERALLYAKRGCTAEDAEARFFVHVFPAPSEDGRPNVGGNGDYEWIGFAFEDRGHRLEDKCWTSFPLPSYPIAGIRTGQYTGAGWKWDVRVPDAGLDALKVRGVPANTAR